jgi:hypothetical protein
MANFNHPDPGAKSTGTHKPSLFQPIELSYVNLVLKQELANWNP